MLKRWVSVALALAVALCIGAILLPRPSQAVEITPMEISDKLVDLIKEMEGFVATPQWDYGQWSVGFGSRCPDEDLERYKANGITPQEAHDLMMMHLDTFEKAVNNFMIRKEIQLNQHQFDAVVSFVYNLGTAVLGDDSSSVIQAICNGAQGNDLIGAFSKWCSAGGEFSAGLMRRRMVESYMYLYGTYDAAAPSTACYVRYDPNGGVRESRAQGYDSNLAAAPLSIPTREGYIFVGWYTEATGGQLVTALDESTHGMTLYAHWEAGKHQASKPTDPETGIEVVVTEPAVTVRRGPGAAYNMVTRAYENEKIVITGTTEKDGTLWGLFSKGWICLEYTDYYERTGTTRPGQGTVEPEQIQVPIKATVLTSSPITVYGGPHTSYPKKGTLSDGDVIEILEVMNFCDQLWGRYEDGWVRINQKIMVHDDRVLAHSFIATVKYYTINVRTGPGTHYSYIQQIIQNDQVEIIAIDFVNGQTWGRCKLGWIFLDSYTDYDSSKLSYYQNHTYGQWVTSSDPTCTEDGELRQTCKYCDKHFSEVIPATGHSYGEWHQTVAPGCETPGQEQQTCAACGDAQTKEIPALGHTMGEWHQTVAPGCETPGQEQQTCAACDHTLSREIPAVGHTMGEWTQTVAPGCETPGQEQQTCTVCDHTETRETPAAGHSYGQWYMTVEPTNTTEGEERRDCENCDHYETAVLEVTEHIFTQWYVTLEPTCSTEGQEQRDCEHCDLVQTRVVPVKEHSYGQWYTTMETSCSVAGEERRDCENCEHFETRQIPVSAHTFGEWQLLEQATCSTPGQEQRECGICHHKEQRETALAEHTLGQWQVFIPAGCDTPGEERLNCSECAYFESRPIEAAGHSMGQWQVLHHPTCTEEGVQWRGCDKCDHCEYDAIPKQDHSYGKWQTVTAPTMDSEGQEKHSCVYCGYEESRTIPVIPSVEKIYATVTHTEINIRANTSTSSTKMGTVLRGQTVEFLELKEVNGKTWGRMELGWMLLSGYATIETVREPLVADDGEKTYATLTCNSLTLRSAAGSTNVKLGTLYHGARVRLYEITTVNGNQWGRTSLGWIWLTGYTTVEVEPATHEHTFGDWYVEELGDCVTHGQERRDCTGCDHFEVREGSFGSHHFGQWQVAKAATCAEGGQEYRDCSLCGFRQTRTTEPSDEHQFGEWYIGEAAGCETPGYRRRDCQHCAVFERLVIPATGHSFGQWYEKVAPSCDTEGQMRRDCENCNHYESKVIDALGHKFGDWYVYRPATAQETGLERRECVNCDHYEERETPKLEHSFGDWETVTAPTIDQEGEEQRACIQCGHTESRPIPVIPSAEKIYATVTLYSGINIRSTTSTSGTKMGTVDKGQTVEILELKVVSGKTWGRVELGWMLLTDYATIVTVREPVTEDSGEKLYATVTAASVIVRTAAGSSNSKVGTLYSGARVRVYETTTVSGKQWGRTGMGWIQLTGNTTVETEAGEHTHSFGDWYLYRDATIDQAGEERRECSLCDHYETREIPVIPSVEKTYATVTLASGINIRVTTSTTSTKMGTADKGSVVEILELKVVNGKTWGRMDLGWMLLSDYATIETVREPVTEDSEEKMYATITSTSLNVRAAAGSSSTRVGTVYSGARMLVYETATVNGKQWGRIAFGWIQLTDNTTLEIESVPDTHTHTFGDWYLYRDATIDQAGEERRDCSLCDHYETREIPVIPSVERIYATVTLYSGINIRSTTSTSGTKMGTVDKGQTVEILELKVVSGKTWGRVELGWMLLTDYATIVTVREPVTEDSGEKLYATVTAASVIVRTAAGSSNSKVGTLYSGARVRVYETTTVSDKQWGRTGMGWIQLTGNTTVETESGAHTHSFGDWYTYLEATVEHDGEERRECSLCDHYESRTIQRKVYGIFNGTGYMNIRSGAGTSYSAVGKLYPDERVEILELVEVDGKVWGRVAEGWVCVTGYIELEMEIISAE